MKRRDLFSGRRKALLCSVVAVFSAVSILTAVSYYSPSQRAQREASFLLKTYRITNLQALVDEFTAQQFEYIELATPGVDPWDQSAGVYPVDWSTFPKELQDGLIAYLDAGGAPLYDLYIYQDAANRTIVFANSDDEVIYEIDCPYDEYCDPATYALLRMPDLYSGTYTQA